MSYQDFIDFSAERGRETLFGTTAFYVNKASEQKRGTPRLVINYKPLNTTLKWIRYPIPNKKDLLQKLHYSFVFLKFYMKSGFWQIQIDKDHHYKTAFTVPFG